MFKLFIFAILCFSLKVSATGLPSHSAFIDDKNIHVTFLGDTCNSKSISLEVSNNCSEGDKTCEAKLVVMSTMKGCGPGVKAYTESISRSSLGLPKSLKKIVILHGHESDVRSYEVGMTKKRDLAFAVSKSTLYVSTKTCDAIIPKLIVEDYCRSDRQGRNESPFCHASLKIESFGLPFPCQEMDQQHVVSKVSLRESRVDKRANWLIITKGAQEYKVQLR